MSIMFRVSIACLLSLCCGCEHQPTEIFVENDADSRECRYIENGRAPWETYRSRKIGDLCWFTKDLTAKAYQDGSPIEGARVSGADGERVVYTWAAANDPRGSCPAPYRVPTDEDFKALEIAAGMDSDDADESGWRGSAAGTRLRKSGDVSEVYDDASAKLLNRTGFSALPTEGVRAHYWTSSEEQDEAWSRSLSWGTWGWDRHSVKRSLRSKTQALSVRCVADYKLPPPPPRSSSKKPVDKDFLLLMDLAHPGASGSRAVDHPRPPPTRELAELTQVPDNVSIYWHLDVGNRTTRQVKSTITADGTFSYNEGYHDLSEHMFKTNENAGKISEADLLELIRCINR